MTATTISPLTLMALRDQLKVAYASIGETVRWAHYAPTELGYGMARMTQQILSEVETVEIQVFKEIAPAMAFLGVGVERVQHVCESLRFGVPVAPQEVL